MKEVETQYNKWVYPKPITDMKEQIKQGFYYDLHLNLFEKIIFPEGKNYDSAEIFIAGCGTNQAIYYALSYPNTNIYAIDLSSKTIEHNKKMIKQYNIKNLFVEQKDIMKVGFKNKYDLVVASGVIHHTQNPKETLKKLSNSGKENCAMLVSVYSSYSRVGVYFLQKVFKLLNLNQSKNDIEMVKRFIQSTPQRHPIHGFMQGSKELEYDSGIVDTFLHKRDVAYDVPELKNLIKESGLYMQSWHDNIHYYPFVLSEELDKEAQRKIDRLTFWEQAEMSQNINLSSKMFHFTLRKSKKFECMWHEKKSLTKNTIINHRPGTTVTEKADLSKGTGGNVRREIPGSFIDNAFSGRDGILWSSVSNSDPNSFSDIMTRANEFCSKNSIDIRYDFESVQDFFHKMWKRGFVIFEL